VLVLKDSIWIVLTLCVNWNRDDDLLAATDKNEVDMLEDLLEWVAND
jgi:hypothetical protein